MIDPPGAGAWNMAVDEMLLEWAAAQRGCCLRFYSWREATLSLGYFQEYRDRAGHGPSRKCPVVRRLTGGGAIVHDAELTYSLVVPAGHPLAARRELLYQAAHGSLIETLGELGIAATLCREKGSDPFSAGKIVLTPFLCFQRLTAGDVLVGGTKIAGSAQRRRRGAVLQHGSVLLRRSAAAPELPALEDAAGKGVAAEQLAALWQEKLAPRLAPAWVPRGRTPAEDRRAASLLEDRYGSSPWTERRGRDSL
jgi:lipoate-protein ligase A